MKFIRNHLFVLWFIVVAALLAITTSTTPESVGPAGIALFFAVFYLFCFLSIVTLLRGVFRSRANILKDTKTFAGVGFAALVPTIVLALQSLGQLVWRDVLILFGLALLAVFYWTKRG